MRRYHRWLALLAGIFILWIGVTGVLTQSARLYASGERRPAQPVPARPPAAEAPRPPQSAAREFVEFITDLHSGARFGLVGQLISLTAGLALIFFAISGMWMYLEMFRARARRERPEEGKWFW